MLKRTLIAAVAAIGFSSSAQALVLAHYDLAPASGTSLNVTATAAGITASALTLHNAANTASAFGNNFRHNGWSMGVDPDKYYQATIGAASAFTLSTIDFSLQSNIDPSAFVLRSSEDGFTANLGTGSLVDGNANAFSVDVSSLGILNGPLTLRWYIVGIPGPNFLAGFSNNECPGPGCGFSGPVGQDLRINGDFAAVPEPGTTAILALSLAGLCYTRRRRAA